VVLVAAPAALDRARAFVREWRFDDVINVVPGGDTRQQSVRAGVEALEGAGIVVVHDGARPLVTPQLIAQGVEIAREHGAAICATPARDTIKQVEGDPPVIRATIDRDGIWLAQTPQVFARDLLLRAHAQSAAAATDDAFLVEALGHAVRVYDGGTWNMKVTSQEDLVVAEALLRARFAG
jgi:2-C-methyl-D-erythritol 4-phosphate cytidylyltransferase